ncbi:unnamed protein product [Alopecurus aequalis]
MVGERVPETSSRCMTERITGTFNFEVANYTQIKGMPVGEFVSSRDFRVGGYDWRINFYPMGIDKHCGGSTSAFLQYVSQGKDVRAKFTLSVLARGVQTPIATYEALEQQVEHVFSPERNDWGYHDFVARSKLKSLSSNGDGAFTIHCVLAVIKESPPLQLLDHLDRMLQDGACADITFGVGGQEFRAHWSVLVARSPGFREQFFGNPSNMYRDVQHIEVVDMDVTTFQMMLHYIYTDSMPPCSNDQDEHNDDVLQHLLVAANRYGMERLKMMCEEELCKRMDVENVKARYSVAKEHCCKRLKDACLQFMSSPEVLDAVLEKVNLKDT